MLIVVEARLLRFLEAKNVKRGGELMWMDLLIVDVNVSDFFCSYQSFWVRLFMSFDSLFGKPDRALPF